MMFLIMFVVSSISIASADSLITEFQIKASTPPHDKYTDIDTITIEWKTSEVSDADLTVDGTTHTFTNQTSFEKNIGQFSASTTIGYSLDVQSGNLTDHRSGSISIKSGSPQISVNVVEAIESDVTLVWQDTVKRTLTVEIENIGKQSGTASYSYTGDTTLKSWLDKTQGQVSISGFSNETITFSVSVPYTAAERTYTGNIEFQYDGGSKNIPITIAVSQPPPILDAEDLNIGNAKVGSTYTKTLTIKEVGHYKKLTISSITVKGRLVLINYPHEIPAGGSGTINLKFTLPDEAMSPGRYSDDVVMSTNAGTKTAEVIYNIPVPELSIKSEKNSYEVPVEPGSSSKVSIPLDVKESGGYNHLKNTRLTYKWISYPGKNPDILNYFDVGLSSDSFSLIRKGEGKAANLQITVRGTAPRGVYTLQILGTAGNNDGKVSKEEIEISNVPQDLIDVIGKLEGLHTYSDNQSKIKTKTLNLLYMVKQEPNKYVDDVAIACELGDNTYEFIYLMGNIKYPTSMEQSDEIVTTVSMLHTRYTSLTNHLRHFKDKNMIDLDRDTVKNEEERTVTNIISHIKQTEPETLCEERSKYRSIKEIYATIGSKEQADEYDKEIARVNQEIDDNKTIAKSYEDEASKYADEFRKISGIEFMLHYSNCRETYADTIRQYESANSTYEYIGNDCKSDSERVSADIEKIEEKLNQLENFRSTTIFGFMFVFGLLLINIIAVERKRIPEKRIEKRCKKLWG